MGEGRMQDRESHEQQQEQARQREQPRQPQPPEPSPGESQVQAEEARAQYEADLQKRQDEAYQREHASPVIGAQQRAYVPPPNATMTRAGPMTMRFAIEGLPIFQRYGKRYQVVQTVSGGVLAMDLEYSEPKPVVFMKAPEGHEQEPAPEK